MIQATVPSTPGMTAGGVGEPPPTPPTTEKLFAGKYKTVEEMEAGYVELQKKLGAVAPPATPPGTPPPEVPPGGVPPMKPGGESIDISTYEKEFLEKGELSPASYEALAKKGLSKETVDAYIEGQANIATKKKEAAFAIAGGETQYAAMIEWAAANLTDVEKAAYNKALGEDDATRGFAITGLYSRFAKTQTPSMLHGDNIPPGYSGDVFTSMAQLTEAMKDKRYTTDEAFREAVKQKLARSKIM